MHLDNITSSHMLALPDQFQPFSKHGHGDGQNVKLELQNPESSNIVATFIFPTVQLKAVQYSWAVT